MAIKAAFKDGKERWIRAKCLYNCENFYCIETSSDEKGIEDIEILFITDIKTGKEKTDTQNPEKIYKILGSFLCSACSNQRAREIKNTA